LVANAYAAAFVRAHVAHTSELALYAADDMASDAAAAAVDLLAAQAREAVAELAVNVEGMPGLLAEPSRPEGGKVHALLTAQADSRSLRTPELTKEALAVAFLGLPSDTEQTSRNTIPDVSSDN
jgi:hypothetical protein